ncbi:MAG: tripartite tricarboxylate transporter substrate binding protein [Polaromonas sp.]|nr:tripartite tricarboxylate transporter substrate binding protein [Polaromonas sp.]
MADTSTGRRRAVRTIAATGLGLCAPVALIRNATAAAYPERPLKMVVTYPAGGSTDVIARAVAVRLGERIGQPVLIDNRGGASGMLGSEWVARAPQDGYTLMMAVADTHSINPHVYAGIRYDARRHFTPVGLVGYVSYALIVSPGVAATTVPEFVALARSQPGKLTFASWGVGSSGQVAMELLKAHAKIDLLHVPFQGAAPAIAAVMSGQVDAMMVPLTLADPNHRAGKVRLLGVAAPRRFEGSPDTPTFAEQGLPLTAGVWLGVLGPAGLPATVVARLNRELNAALAEPALRETLVRNGLEAMPRTADAFRSFMRTEYERWGAVVRGAAIRAEGGS